MRYHSWIGNYVGNQSYDNQRWEYRSALNADMTTFVKPVLSQTPTPPCSATMRCYGRPSTSCEIANAPPRASLQLYRSLGNIARKSKGCWQVFPILHFSPWMMYHMESRTSTAASHSLQVALRGPSDLSAGKSP